MSSYSVDFRKSTTAATTTVITEMMNGKMIASDSIQKKSYLFEIASTIS